jgi:pimeloyl-ACP methyl ester carboxylesterase
MLSGRLAQVTDWIGQDPRVRALRAGYFGASTGAAAALVAASERPDIVRAVVSRGGRPDLAGPTLQHVLAATLLIVGGADEQVIRLNDMAYAELRGVREMDIVPGATHLFEEPGALDRVADLALGWFQRHL